MNITDVFKFFRRRDVVNSEVAEAAVSTGGDMPAEVRRAVEAIRRAGWEVREHGADGKQDDAPPPGDTFKAQQPFMLLKSCAGGCGALVLSPRLHGDTFAQAACISCHKLARGIALMGED